jgi:hypothetical protein
LHVVPSRLNFDMSSPKEVTLRVVIICIQCALCKFLHIIVREVGRVGRARAVHDIVVIRISAAEWTEDGGSPVKICAINHV